MTIIKVNIACVLARWKSFDQTDTFNYQLITAYLYSDIFYQMMPENVRGSNVDNYQDSLNKF